MEKLSIFPDSKFHSTVVLKKIDQHFHTGIIYKNEDEGSISILHLAFHIDLVNDDFKTLDCADKNYWATTDRWIIPIDFEESFQKSLSAYCATIHEKNLELIKIDKRLSIFYGLMTGDSRFNKDGTLILGKDCSGLSCSSFVLAVFKSVGINLIDLADWPARDSDIPDHEKLLGWLKGRCEKLGQMDHFEKVQKEKGSPRVKPSEVAASLRFPNMPGPRDPIRKLGEELEQALTSAPTPPTPSPPSSLSPA